MQTGSKRTYTVSAAAWIPAPKERVYAVIANYRDGHPHILPKEFSGMTVEEGGIGAGTVIRFQMRVFGRKQTFRAAITEPDPGHVLVETDLDSNVAVTTFTVISGRSPKESHVTITTELRVRGGLGGVIERFLSTRLLYPIYVRELALLAKHVAEERSKDGPLHG